MSTKKKKRFVLIFSKNITCLRVGLLEFFLSHVNYLSVGYDKLLFHERYVAAVGAPLESQGLHVSIHNIVAIVQIRKTAHNQNSDLHL